MDIKQVKRRNTGCLIVILIFLAVVVALSVIAVLRMGTMGGSDAAKISTEEYDRVETGMSYAQVKEIVGGDGILQTETGSVNQKGHTAQYIWDGEGTFGSMGKFTFVDSKLTEKEQYGLK